MTIARSSRASASRTAMRRSSFMVAPPAEPPTCWTPRIAPTVLPRCDTQLLPALNAFVMLPPRQERVVTLLADTQFSRNEPTTDPHATRRARDERGELRGLLWLLGFTVLLAAIVFGFGLRKSSKHPAAAVTTATTLPAGTVTTTTVAAPTGDPRTPTTAAAGAPAPTAAPSAPSGPRTTQPPQQSGPAPTSPPAPAPTAPPPTQPPATPPPTTPPTTAAPPVTCGISFANATPKQGTPLDFTVTSSPPNGTISGSFGPVGAAGSSYGVTGNTGPSGSARFTNYTTPSDTPAGTQYRMTLTVGGQTKTTCSATFTTS